MNTRISAISLSLLAGACALAIPGISQAGNVGYMPTCDRFGQGDPTTLITAAGHTPVAIATADAASLTGLQALMVSNCNYDDMASTINPAIASAVSGGMKLIISDWNPGASTAAALPGSPAIVMTYDSGTDIDIPAGSPVASGPGGTLTNASMDGGNQSNHGYTSSVLPTGSIAMLTTGDPTQKVGFQYKFGSGTIAYSAIPLDFYFPGGGGESNASYPTSARTYVINLLAFTVTPPVDPGTSTCASEGFIGQKLIWCKNICENGLTGRVLDTWIWRWVSQYRKLPYCAVGGGG